VVLLLVAVIALRVHPRGTVSGCEESVPTQSISPDGKWAADEVIELCRGALRSQSTKVLIREDGQDQAVVFEMAGVADLRLTWQDSRHLTVVYPLSAEPSRQVGKFDEVSIEYRVGNGQ
jgi:hypothetical protein